ncbi:hypothetical protein C5612_10275 [Pseudomonas frederiksbergensis]|uniref:Uncharacterized protein n=1 Tax=Pseudomonas frederiksbergensis TaxID=104087 RepID=A0A2S8HP97_9PSED|nr:hypothetical protein [Pseudomonas frederiksbergensis]PQP04373.1 hypothetical protein C5612_10275 [Pseudomonas frederiksbergensis]
MKIMGLLGRKYFVSVLLVFVGAVGLFVYTKEDQMSARVMMYYGSWSPEEIRFDATKWFSSGMYRPRLMGSPPEASPVTMLRNKPETLQSIDNDTFLSKALVAIEGTYPKVDTEDLILNTPDLRRQIRYAFSSFSKPDKPQDTYWLFVTIHGKTYVVTFDWDVNEKTLDVWDLAQHIAAGSDEETAYREVVKELADSAPKR